MLGEPLLNKVYKLEEPGIRILNGEEVPVTIIKLTDTHGIIQYLLDRVTFLEKEIERLDK